MKITVDISDNDLKDILRFTGEKKKGPAIANLIASNLMLRRRHEMAEKVMSGEWQFKTEDWKVSRERERAKNAWMK